jgi:hypothetical protein
MRPARHDPHLSGLNPAAAAFEFAVVWLTMAGFALTAIPAVVARDDWLTFAILVPIIAAVHLVGAERQKHQGSHLSLAPIFAAALLLSPALTALAIVIAFVPETVRSRPRWYIAVFNIANFVGPALLAGACFDAVGGTGDTSWALAASAGIAAFVISQYAVLAVMLRLARGVRVLDTVRVDCVLIDAGLVSLGAVGAALWEINQGLVALTLLPLALAYRSLAIPGLLEAARIEPKTGPLQHAPLPERPVARAPARGAVQPAARRAHDRRRPSARDQHGARPPGGRQGPEGGCERAAERDAGVRRRSALRGDEFCVVLPETDLEGALVVAQRIRSFVESSSSDPKVTVSVGVATHKGGGTTTEALVALADRAAYRAKFSGRNSVAVPPEGDPVDEAERVLYDASYQS